jgi:carbamoyltransferase
MKILGTNFAGHDSSICLLDTDKKSIFAISTERVTRIKHDSIFTEKLIKSFTPNFDILSIAGKGFLNEETAHALYEIQKQDLKRILFQPQYLSQLLNITDKMYLDKIINHPEIYLKAIQHKNALLELDKQKHFLSFFQSRGEFTTSVIRGMFNEIYQGDLEFYDHHLCHAVSAYYTSPFAGKKSLVLTLDGMGDAHSSKLYVFSSNGFINIGASPSTQIDSTGQISLGLLYTSFTLALGFSRGDEGKVEALAAFGKFDSQIYNTLIRGTSFFNNGIFFSQELKPFVEIKSLKRMLHNISKENAAATIQKYLEDIVLLFLSKVSKLQDFDRIIISGGVAANIILNMRIYESNLFKDIHICPFMGDEGLSVGSAILTAIAHGEDISFLSHERMPYWGPEFTLEDVYAALTSYQGIQFSYLGDFWINKAARSICENKIIGVFKSKMEFGPRALGNRSILANPSDPKLREKLNISIKKRPPWQPFCPTIIDEDRDTLFEKSFDHKHMAIAFRMRPHYAERLPSAVHIDGTARPQFVSQSDNAHFYKLLKEVKKLTGIGAVINTSFNLHGRAMVMSPHQAIDDFLDCNLDSLFIEGFEVTRQN